MSTVSVGCTATHSGAHCPNVRDAECRFQLCNACCTHRKKCESPHDATSKIDGDATAARLASLTLIAHDGNIEGETIDVDDGFNYLFVHWSHDTYRRSHRVVINGHTCGTDNFIVKTTEKVLNISIDRKHILQWISGRPKSFAVDFGDNRLVELRVGLPLNNTLFWLVPGIWNAFYCPVSAHILVLEQEDSSVRIPTHREYHRLRESGQATHVGAAGTNIITKLGVGVIVAGGVALAVVLIL
jgi:hypothetical protein